MTAESDNDHLTPEVEPSDNAPNVLEPNVVEPNEIGRASCRERV